MRQAEWKRIVRRALPHEGDLNFRGWLCYRAPMRWLVQGLLAESSGFDQGTYLWAVRMPLFAPQASVISLSWSTRVGGPSRKFSPDETEELQAAVRQAWADLPSEEDALQSMAASPISRNGLINEELGYARLILGDLSGAREALEAVPAPEGDIVWHAELKQRADMVLEVLNSEGPHPALRRLSNWRTQTGTALGLSHQVMNA